MHYTKLLCNTPTLSCTIPSLCVLHLSLIHYTQLTCTIPSSRALYSAHVHFTKLSCTKPSSHALYSVPNNPQTLVAEWGLYSPNPDSLNLKVTRTHTFHLHCTLYTRDLTPVRVRSMGRNAPASPPRLSPALFYLPHHDRCIHNTLAVHHRPPLGFMVGSGGFPDTAVMSWCCSLEALAKG